MLPCIRLEYEFVRWTALTYCNFNQSLKTNIGGRFFFFPQQQCNADGHFNQ